MADEQKTILVVEDEPSMSHILKDRLELEGYRVLVAGDGENGLELALHEHPDLIVLDIVLPRKNGAELLQELVRDEWGKTASVMCLTNLMTVPESIKEIMKTHKNIDYIVKVDTRLDNIIQKVTDKVVSM